MLRLSKALILGVFLTVSLIASLLFATKRLPIFSTHLGSEPIPKPEVTSPPLLLSSDIGFPTPVIQLQQTIAHGLIEAERVDLPLLNGELSEFSQSNIHEKYQAPPDIEHLKQRLEALQILSH